MLSGYHHGYQNIRGKPAKQREAFNLSYPPSVAGELQIIKDIGPGFWLSYSGANRGVGLKLMSAP